ncbi:MAG: histidine kinase dimerization/phosphoacceptor domain -containing protein [Spirochaetota bacterium]
MDSGGMIEGDAVLIEAYEAYQAAYFKRRDLPATLAFFDSEIGGFGSAPDEFAAGLEAARRLYGRDIAQVAAPVGVDRDFLIARRLGPDFGLVMERSTLTIDTADGRLVIPGLRGSYAFVRRAGEWKMVQFHISTAMSEVEESESYPIEALRARNEELERLVALRTSELERALAEKEALLKEVHHRIKNNMATIAAIFTLNAGEHPGAAGEALLDAAGRVNSMMALYDQLYRKEAYRDLRFRDYVGTLLGGLENTIGSERKVLVENEVSGAILSVEDTFHLGIVINELVTNAYKYAFQGRADGTIRVSFVGEDPATWLLEVGDDGVGLPAGAIPASHGFGMSLVEVMAKQLGASFVAENSPGGGARLALVKGRGKTQDR